nr:hypothetical protein [uncultured Leptotrichia sp.]
MKRVILLIIFSINVMYCKEKKVFGIKPDYPYEGIIINQIFHSSDNEDYLKNLTTGSTPLYYDGKTNTFIHNVYNHYTMYYSHDFVLKSKNYVEKKAQIYFRKNNYPEIHCLNNLDEESKSKVLNFFSFDIEKYYMNLYPTCIIKKDKESNILFGKWEIENNKVSLELHYNNFEIRKISKKNNEIFKIIEKIDSIKQEEGYYWVSDYNFEYTIFTPNKILHKKDISLSENEEKLINTLKILFKNEFLKEYWCKSRIFNSCFKEKNEQSKD